jgi:hypothetical protein
MQDEFNGDVLTFFLRPVPPGFFRERRTRSSAGVIMMTPAAGIR